MELRRITIRIPFLILATAFFFLLWLAGKLLTVSSERARRWWRKLIFGGWARSVAAIIGMSISVKGEPPKAPFFLVSNHLSYMDIIALAACLDCVFIARADLADWFAVGWMARSIGTIFIERAKIHDLRRGIRLVNQTLNRGMGVILFPEGTSGAGDKILPFHASLLEPAARANYPVSFASVSYRTPQGEPPAYMAISWWGDMTFAPHVKEMLKLSRFDAHVTFGSHAIRADDRKLLAKGLWNAVNDQFVPMVNSALLSSEKE